MGKIWKTISLAVVVCALNTIGITKADTTLKFALAAPEKTPWTAHARELAASMEAATNNTIKVEVFPGGQLGNEQDVIRQVVRGRIQMGAFSNTAASLVVPEIALLAAPYLWESLEEADCVLDKHMTSVFEEKFKQKGLILLGWSEVGLMGYASKNPMVKIEDLVGAKMRVAPTKASLITAKTLGANSVVLPITEVASALQTGLVDSADLPGLTFAAFGIGKIAPNWYATNHSHQVGLMVMSQKVWRKFSLEEQGQIMKAQLSADLLRSKVRTTEKVLLEKFVRDGGNFVSLSDIDRKKMDVLGAKATLELVEELGGDSKEIYKKILRAKKECH